MTEKKSLSRRLIPLFLLTCLALPAAADSGNEELHRELVRLTRAMTELVELVKTQIGRQESDLLLRRVELFEIRLRGRQARLESAEAEKVRADEELASLQHFLRGVESEISKQIENGGSASAETLAQQEQVEDRILYLERRRKTVDLEIVKLEDELRDLEDKLEELETALDARLGL